MVSASPNNAVKRFLTEAGVVVAAVTAAEMREIDRIATEETGPNLFQMMENAGCNLASLTLKILGERWKSARVVVLAGGGANGGGAICAGRHLANRDVRVELCIADPERMNEASSFQRKIFQSTGGQEVEARHVWKSAPDLILDGLIGYGLKGAPRGTVADLIQWADDCGAQIVSLDVPSGVDASSGQSRGKFIKPGRTMTLALPKTGLLPERSGELFLSDIGIPAGAYHRVGLRYLFPFGNRFWVRLIAEQ